MTEPSTSQPAPPHIFIAEDGSPLKVFVEASGISGRPKIVRKLKKSGAHICKDPSHARVILVDPSSIQGRQFIREWGLDSNKVVLEYRWVSRCLDAMQLLGTKDEWGGFLTKDDGLPLNIGDIDDESPALPTPRVTPIESAPRRTSPRNAVAGPSGVKSDPAESKSSEAPTPVQSSNLEVTNPSSDESPGSQLPPQPHLDPQVQAMLAQHGLLQGPNLAALVEYLRVYAPYSLNPSIIYPSANTPQVNPLNFLWGNMSFAPQIPPQGAVMPPPMSFPPHLQPISVATPAPLTTYVPASTSHEPEVIEIKEEHNADERLSPAIRAPEDLFRGEDSKEHTFFVQVDLHNRFALVNDIKKHGGKIVNNHTQADFVVLYQRSKSFSELQKSSINKGKTPVSAAFVRDSISRGTLMDPKRYVFEVVDQQRKRRTQAALDDTKSGKLEKEVKKRKINTTTLSETEIRHPPSPPPPEHPRIAVGNTFRYSNEEKDYMNRYIEVLLERDHTISVRAISQQMHRKLPYRTLRAWTQYIGKEARDHIDQTRKKQSIAFRKAQNARNPAEALCKAEPEEPQNLLMGPDDSGQTFSFQAFNEDVETIARFFATGGTEDQEDDGQAFSRLAASFRCQTASSWDEFYHTYHQNVAQRYEQLVKELYPEGV
ncbi:hypothetical protein BDN72DRAFT_830322 [Pluteus cervinus]|uniref:Uncharacterized protein n=1 Tax=Pluteus cervinus TaxID=181527 RepID=A0ACD3BGY8_9AGAR|nr:hypothetical protein BDN72DRAFT_830322 [Pluteus cervinus]